MIAALLASALVQASPVFLDDRAEIPWLVAVSPGSTCGSLRTIEGPRSERERLLAKLATQPETKPPKTKPTTTTLPLLPTPGLLGVEGEVIVVAAERILQKLGTPGSISLVVDAAGARLELPALPPTADPAFAAWAPTPAELQAIVDLARARVAKRRAVIGNWAREGAQRQSCFAVVADPALPQDLSRRLRVRLSAPLRR